MEKMELKGFVSEDLYGKIMLLYEYLTVHRKPSSDLKLSELVGKIIELGYPALLKRYHIKFIGIKEDS